MRIIKVLLSNRPKILKDGGQQALLPYNDPVQLPIMPLRQENGEWLRLEIALPGYSVWLRAWQVQLGRAKLYLLDSNYAANFPAHREITSELYGGGPELRLKQELLLGIGGWRLPPVVIGLLCNLKANYGANIVVVSNEGRELNAYRIRKFNLDGFVDALISSCFVRLLKPDADIFRLALDIAQVPLKQAVYIENTPMFIEVAQGLGIRSILHANHESTTAKLSAVGLKNTE